MTFDYKKYIISVVIIFSLKILILGLYPFHHPSEARYAAIAMRMELNNNYLMPYFDPVTPFFAKPPLAFWASALSFKVFGFNEFAARLPHLLALAAICFLLYRCLTKTTDKKTAIISVLILCSCALFYTLHTVMTEAFLLLAMTMITTSFWLQLQSQKSKNIDGYLFFFGCIIAMLTKGLVGILMPCLPIFIYLLISARWKELWQKFPIFLGTLIFIILGLSWFLAAEIKYPGFLEYFFIGENLNRFIKPGWNGDKYGNAHEVPFAMIWYFFIAATLPVILLFFLTPKQIFFSFLQKISPSSLQNMPNLIEDSDFFKKNKIYCGSSDLTGAPSNSKLTQSDDKSNLINYTTKERANPLFLFFFLSFISPLIVLTFMKNMIMTYAIYSLVPFVVLVSIVIAEKNRYKFITFLAYFTPAIHCLLIILFLTFSDNLAQHLNYQAYLVKQIPASILKKGDFILYHLGQRRDIYSLYWYSKDQVQILNKDNFAVALTFANPEKYVIADLSEYFLLPPKYRLKLQQITCVKKRHNCLYKLINQS
jgi:4-amino-4-deoxy-L-arabinose transferase-like glycosyltransferase